MNIVNSWPPNIEAIRGALDIPKEEPIFTYGDTIFNPYGHRLDPGLIAHEETHAKQQAAIGGPDVWWERYLRDPQFRADQELAAYKRHFRKLKKFVRDRNVIARCVDEWARLLAGPMYGGCVTYHVAMVKIKS